MRGVNNSNQHHSRSDQSHSSDQSRSSDRRSHSSDHRSSDRRSHSSDHRSSDRRSHSSDRTHRSHRSSSHNNSQSPFHAAKINQCTIAMETLPDPDDAPRPGSRVTYFVDTNDVDTGHRNHQEQHSYDPRSHEDPRSHQDPRSHEDPRRHEDPRSHVGRRYLDLDDCNSTSRSNVGSYDYTYDADIGQRQRQSRAPARPSSRSRQSVYEPSESSEGVRLQSLHWGAGAGGAGRTSMSGRSSTSRSTSISGFTSTSESTSTSGLTSRSSRWLDERDRPRDRSQDSPRHPVAHEARASVDHADEPDGTTRGKMVTHAHLATDGNGGANLVTSTQVVIKTEDDNSGCGKSLCCASLCKPKQTAEQQRASKQDDQKHHQQTQALLASQNQAAAEKVVKAKNQSSSSSTPGPTWKRLAATAAVGTAVGAGGMLLLCRSGGTAAAAVAGVFGLSVSTSSRSDVHGNDNIQAGAGTSSAFSFNLISSSDQKTSVQAILAATTTTTETQRVCLQKGMIHRDTADGSWYGWSQGQNKPACISVFPNEELRGYCKTKLDQEASNAGLPLYNRVRNQHSNGGQGQHANTSPSQSPSQGSSSSQSSVRNRRDLSGVGAQAPEPVPVVISTPSSGPDPYQGRVGNQFEWPLQEEDYTAFNAALATGGLLLIKGMHYWFVGPMCTAIRNYLSNDG